MQVKEKYFQQHNSKWVAEFRKAGYRSKKQMKTASKNAEFAIIDVLPVWVVQL